MYLFIYPHSYNYVQKKCQRLGTNLSNQPTEIQQQKKIDIKKKRTHTHQNPKEYCHRKYCTKNKESKLSKRQTYPYVPDDTNIRTNTSNIQKLIQRQQRHSKYRSIVI